MQVSTQFPEQQQHPEEITVESLKHRGRDVRESIVDKLIRNGYSNYNTKTLSLDVNKDKLETLAKQIKKETIDAKGFPIHLRDQYLRDVISCKMPDFSYISLTGVPCNDVGMHRNNRYWDTFLYSYITNFDSRIFNLVEEEIKQYSSLEGFSAKFRASLLSLTRYKEHLMYWPHRARKTAAPKRKRNDSSVKETTGRAKRNHKIFKTKNLSDKKKQTTATTATKKNLPVYACTPCNNEEETATRKTTSVYEYANKEEVNDGENQVEIAEEEETRREPQKHFSEEIVKEKEAQIPDWPREEEVEMTRFNLRRRESTIYDFAPSDSEEDLSSGEDSDIFDPKGEEETDFDLNTPQKRNRESSDEEMIPGSPIYLSPSPHVAGSRSSKYFEPCMKKLKDLDPLQNASTVSNSLHLKPQEQIDTEEPAKKKIQNTKTATVSNSLQQLAQEELVSNQNVSETSYKDNPDHFSQPTDLEKLSSSRIVQEKEDQYSQPLEIVQEKEDQYLQPLEIVQEKEDQYSQPLEIVQDTSDKEKEKASYNIFYGEVSIRIKKFFKNVADL